MGHNKALHKDFAAVTVFADNIWYGNGESKNQRQHSAKLVSLDVKFFRVQKIPIANRYRQPGRTIFKIWEEYPWVEFDSGACVRQETLNL